MRVFINGFGRIGRSVLRAYLQTPAKWPGLEIVGIVLALVVEHEVDLGGAKAGGLDLELGNHRIRVLARAHHPNRNRDVDSAVDLDHHVEGPQRLDRVVERTQQRFVTRPVDDTLPPLPTVPATPART